MKGINDCLMILSLVLFTAFSANAGDVMENHDDQYKFSFNAANFDNSNTVSSDQITYGALIQNKIPRVSMTGSEKFHYYLQSTYGPRSFAYTALSSGIKQAQGSPTEWGGGLEGYGKRYASSFGQKAINRSIRIGLQSLLHEDPRYQPSGHSGFWNRTLSATGQAFFVYKDQGGTRIGYTRFAGNFGAAFISRQWHPDSYRTTGDCLISGFTSIGIDAAKNVFSEFWPDIRKMFHRK